jgi:hypothetical protein
MKTLAHSTAAIAIAFTFVALAPSSASAQITLSQRGCQAYATWSGNIVWARGLGADKDKTRSELIELDHKTPASIFALMLRNFDSLWSTTADWESVMRVVLQDCVTRRGIYESET